MDAVMIDIRRFSDFNGAFGYDLGDQLLQGLCSLLQITLVREDPRVFLAHLGDDRFLATAPAAVLDERLPVLARRFERMAAGYCETVLFQTESQERPAHPVTLELRIVLLPQPFARLTGPRELHRLAERLRRPESGHEAGQMLGSRCLLVREPGPTSYRLSA
jgi:GGDEF domain-containing protein